MILGLGEGKCLPAAPAAACRRLSRDASAGGAGAMNSNRMEFSGPPAAIAIIKNRQLSGLFDAGINGTRKDRDV
jgi:hypothetical protein